MSGWGKLREGGRGADVLRKVVVPIISDQQCAASYSAIGYHGPIKEKMLCAGHSHGSMDACQVRGSVTELQILHIDQA